MNALAFDTHAAVKKLKEAGFTEQQAEAQTTLLMEVIAGELATKHDIETIKHDIETVKLDIENVRAELKRDIETLRTELKHDIETLRAETKHDIAELKHDIAELKRDMKEQEMRLTIKLGAMLALAVGAVATLVKLL